MCSCGGAQNTRISSSIITSGSFSAQSRELPTVSVNVNCTHMFLRVRITKNLTKRLIRRLARWLQLAHQTRGGGCRLGLTGAPDEGMSYSRKCGFGGRSIVESMYESRLGAGCRTPRKVSSVMQGSNLGTSSLSLISPPHESKMKRRRVIVVARRCSAAGDGDGDVKPRAGHTDGHSDLPLAVAVPPRPPDSIV